ncbi:hypothetical protein BCT30_08265 [Enterovibrio norvegicus]|nr:hypothetical protein A1OS_00680 [Enterovibrio norvegicus]OEF49208.1 hypothetical protein A1OW_13200 [Enterovibrio norvegicus]PMH72366.1 hypothetical protein BCU62_22905 [Enterovibrio norvegicus]PMI32629.1 hypothetical protein BCU47_11895 [Enterovibrio norvegicus]PMN55362.1 hypothetical protein BCT30_08265 [Enterovibrio norvegicus]
MARITDATDFGLAMESETSQADTVIACTDSVSKSEILQEDIGIAWTALESKHITKMNRFTIESFIPES